MAGIIASSTTRPMASGETAAAGSTSGYVRAEQITLSTSPTGTNYAWGITIPSESTAARSALSALTGASVTFTPDAGGLYLVSCTVDSTTSYTIVLSVTDTVAMTPVEALRIQEKADAGVPTPTGETLAVWRSATIDALVQKDSSGRIVPLLMGVIGALLTDADQTLQIGEGVHRSQQTALTVNRNKTLGTTGASVGHVLWIHRLDAAAFTLAVINGGVGAGTLVTLPASERHSACFRFDGTNWALESRIKLV